MRRLAATMALVGALASACGAGDPEKSASPAEFEKLDSAPAALAGLYRQPSALLGGGTEAFEQRIDRLRGHPAVVNVWASWCGPCRFEFPFFQRQAVKRGERVAFLAVNSQDNDGDAKRFLEEYPLPFPSYTDPGGELARTLGVVGLPATAYYDRRGKLEFLHQGGYASEAKLAEDIERYAR